MVEAGFIYIAQPPLFSTEVGKEKTYLKDESLAKAEVPWPTIPNHKKEFQRLKGLGEMDWQELALHHHGFHDTHPVASHCRRSRRLQTTS